MMIRGRRKRGTRNWGTRKCRTWNTNNKDRMYARLPIPGHIPSRVR